MDKTVIQAIFFASIKHSSQRRKNPQKDPYINHPIETLSIVSHTSGVTDFKTQAAAVLHDVLEDTSCTKEELIETFGNEIAQIVIEVTDDKTQTKLERKKNQAEKMKTASYPARIIKIADKISNCNSLLESLPEGWTKEDAMGYVAWSKDVVQNCLMMGDINVDTQLAFSLIYNKAAEKFGFKDVPSETILKVYYDSLEKK